MAKIREKLASSNFAPIILDNPITIRDRQLKEVWCEMKGLPQPESEKTWDGPIEVRLEELRRKMKIFEDKEQKLIDAHAKK